MSFLVNFNSVMNLNVMKRTNKIRILTFGPGRTNESFSCMSVRYTEDESANEQKCHMRLIATLPETVLEQQESEG